MYDQLQVTTPTQVVALNRAIALAEADGPAAALAVVDTLDLDGYHLFHAVRADLLARLGRHIEARASYGAAISLTDNRAERDLLELRRDQLPGR